MFGCSFWSGSLWFMFFPTNRSLCFLPLQGASRPAAHHPGHASDLIWPWQLHRRVFSLCLGPRFHNTNTTNGFCTLLLTPAFLQPPIDLRAGTAACAAPYMGTTCQQRRRGSGVYWWRCSGGVAGVVCTISCCMNASFSATVRGWCVGGVWRCMSVLCHPYSCNPLYPDSCNPHLASHRPDLIDWAYMGHKYL